MNLAPLYRRGLCLPGILKYKGRSHSPRRVEIEATTGTNHKDWARKPMLDYLQIRSTMEEPALQSRRLVFAYYIDIEGKFGGYWGSPGFGGPQMSGLGVWAGLHGPHRITSKIIYRVRMGLLNAWMARIESGGFFP